MSYLIKQKLKEIEEMVEESSYGTIDSYDIERLKEKCMGDMLYRVGFSYTIEWIGRESTFYVDTHHYGYWRIEKNGEWTRTDIDEEEESSSEEDVA